MEPKVERSNKEKILRRLAKLLAPSGFNRSKSTFYTRVRLPVIEFVHIHKFTHTPSFRLHLGVRVISDPFRAVALNGPDSDEFQGMPSVFAVKRLYDFNYDESEDSVERCAFDISNFVAGPGEAWFESNRDLERLAVSPKSPLSSDARAALIRALAGEIDEHYVAQTRTLLNAP
jgi:hypothetical protein